MFIRSLSWYPCQASDMQNTHRYRKCIPTWMSNWKCARYYESWLQGLQPTMGKSIVPMQHSWSCAHVYVLEGQTHGKCTQRPWIIEVNASEAWGKIRHTMSINRGFGGLVSPIPSRISSFKRPAILEVMTTPTQRGPSNLFASWGKYSGCLHPNATEGSSHAAYIQKQEALMIYRCVKNSELRLNITIPEVWRHTGAPHRCIVDLRTRTIQVKSRGIAAQVAAVFKFSCTQIFPFLEKLWPRLLTQSVDAIRVCALPTAKLRGVPGSSWFRS